jgi:Leucine-rich repeat (LRR) protein
MLDPVKVIAKRIRTEAKKHVDYKSTIANLRAVFETSFNRLFSEAEIELALNYLFDTYDPNRLASPESFRGSQAFDKPIRNPFSNIVSVDNIGNVIHVNVSDPNDLKKMSDLLLFNERKELQIDGLDHLWKSIKNMLPDDNNLPYFIYFGYVLAVEEVENQARKALQKHPWGRKIEKIFSKAPDANFFLQSLRKKTSVDIGKIIELFLRYGHSQYGEQYWFVFSSKLAVPLDSIRSVYKCRRISLDWSQEERLNRYNEFVNFKNLEAVSIGSYARHVFPDPKFVLPAVEKLSMNGRVKMITPDVKLLKVKKLELLFLNLKKIPPELFELPILAELVLDFNLLVDLPELNSVNHVLTYLAITRNKVNTLPKTFKQIVNLEHLILAKNSFHDLSNFPQLKKLKHLDISGNRLSQLTLNATDFPCLEKLNCYDNKITTIADGATGLKKLRLIDLRFNPIDPDRITWLRQQMPNTKVLH